MGSSLRLGRIAGIEFGVNWSWLVVSNGGLAGILSTSDLARALAARRRRRSVPAHA